MDSLESLKNDLESTKNWERSKKIILDIDKRIEREFFFICEKFDPETLILFPEICVLL